MSCPLCNSITENHFATGGKNYHICSRCWLVYMDKRDHLSADEEKRRYSFHQNSIDDAGYVGFLGRVLNPAMEYLSVGMVGIDYGCGPNPVLSQMLTDRGMVCNYYDPFFFPKLDKSKKYEFVFATECFEHFFSPDYELKQICEILNKGGILGIMTEMYSDVSNFAGWYYKNDPTHVCFYCKKTIEYICEIYGFNELYNDSQRVIILRKL